MTSNYCFFFLTQYMKLNNTFGGSLLTTKNRLEFSSVLSKIKVVFHFVQIELIVESQMGR